MTAQSDKNQATLAAIKQAAQSLRFLEEAGVEFKDDYLTVVSASVHLEELPAGEFFIAAGQDTGKLGFVVQGLLAVFLELENGKSVITRFCDENKFVASYSSRLNQRPSKVSIQAIEPVKILSLPIDVFAGNIANEKSRLFWMQLKLALLEQGYSEKERRLSEVLLYSAKERYVHFVKEFPELAKRLPLYSIAAYLAITPERLSRIRSEIFE